MLLYPGLLVQMITTKQPTDDMIEVAIVSMEQALVADGEAVPTGPASSSSGRCASTPPAPAATVDSAAAPPAPTPTTAAAPTDPPPGS